MTKIAIILKTSPFDMRSEVPIGTRLAPTLCAAIPLIFTALAYRHLRSCKTDADIISNRNVPTGAIYSDKPPKFELDILQDGAIKGIPVFAKDVNKFTQLSKQKGMKGIEDLLPQVRRARKKEEEAARAERRRKRKEKKMEYRKKDRSRLAMICSRQSECHIVATFCTTCKKRRSKVRLSVTGMRKWGRKALC